MKSVSAAAVAGLFLSSGASADVVTSTWTGFGDGSHWTDPANWSTDPNYPQDGGGHGYIARIDRDPGTPYSVLLDTTVFIDGVTLNSPRATLQQTAGGLFMSPGGVIDLQAGTYQLNSATINGARLQSEGGTFTVSDATGTPSTFDNVTLAAPIQVTRGNTLLLKNTLTLDGGSVTLVDTQFGSAPLGLYGSGDVTIGGTGSLIYGGSGGHGIIGCAPNHTLTIGPNVTVNTSATAGGTLGAGQYIDGTNPGTGTLINQGTISTATNGISIPGAWVNQGTINISGTGNLTFPAAGTNQGTINVNGGQLSLPGTSTNQGAINLSDGRVLFNGSFSTANIVGLVRSGTGGKLEFNGTVDNAGRTLDLNTLGTVLMSGTFSGGTVRSDGPAFFSMAAPGTLSDVVFDANLRVAGDTGAPTLKNITMTGHDLIVERTGATGAVDMSAISGSGRVVIAGVPNSSGFTARVTGPLGPTFSLVTDTSDPSARGVGVFTGTNAGTIIAQNPNIPLQLDGAWSNPTGHISAINGGLLMVKTFPGSFGDLSVHSAEVDLLVPLTTAQVRDIAVSRATFGIFNTLTNTNDTFALAGNETLALGGTIVGGSITGTATDQALIRADGGGTLQNVTLGMPFTLQPGAVLNAAGVTLNGTSIHLMGGQSRTTQVNGTVIGSGEIVFDGPSGSNQLTTTGGFVVNPGITVRTGTSSGRVTGAINKGTISANTLGQIILDGAWDNTQGTIRAGNGGIISLSGTTSTPKLGNLVNDNGGTITFAGGLDNAGQTFRFGGSTGTWNFSGQVTGGTVDLTGAAVHPIPGGPAPVLDSVTLASDVQVGNQVNAGPSLGIRNAIDAAGHTISVVNTGGGGSPGATLQFVLNTPFTLDNAHISLSNATLSTSTQFTGTTLTLGPSTVVSGSGAMTSFTPPAGTGYDNRGEILANVKDQTLTVRPASIVNHGMMAATDGGVLSIAPVSVGFTWTNDGVLDAGAGSRISVAKDLVFADGSAYDVSFDPTGAVGLLQVSGMLDLSHVESLNLDVPPGTPPGTYTIATYTSGYRGAFDQVTPGYSVDYSTPGQIRVTVPEPAGGCLIAIAGVSLLSRWRRKRGAPR